MRLLLLMAAVTLPLMLAGQGARTGGPRRRVSPPPTRSQPRYSPVQEELDAGKVTRGRSARYEFTIRNTGSAPLKLSIKATCACTLPNPDLVIAPGRSGKIVADLNTSDLSGEVTKTLVIRTNDPRQPTSALYMKATVVSLAEVEPSPSITMQLDDEGSTETTLTIRLQKGETAEIRDATTTFPGLRAYLSPLPDEDGRRTYKLTLQAGPTMPRGVTSARVILQTTSPLEPAIRINVRCEKGIVVTPLALFIDGVPVKPVEPVSRFITLRRNKGDFRILGLSCSDPSLSFETTRLVGAIGWRITLRYAGGWTEGWVRTAIVVETDDPYQPRITIPITARVGSKAGGP